MNWQNLIENPPSANCDICLKVGDNYETYKFCRNGKCWHLAKPPREYPPETVPAYSTYIILNQD